MKKLKNKKPNFPNTPPYEYFKSEDSIIPIFDCWKIVGTDKLALPRYDNNDLKNLIEICTKKEREIITDLELENIELRKKIEKLEKQLASVPKKKTDEEFLLMRKDEQINRLTHECIAKELKIKELRDRIEIDWKADNDSD